MISSPLSGRLVGAGHARIALVVAGAGVTTGGLLLTTLAADTSTARLVLAYGIFGVGLGSVNAPITNTAVSGMPRSQAGLAAAVASASRQVGTSLGVALAGALAGAGIESAHSPAFAASTHVVFWLVVANGVGIAVVGLASTGAWAKASAQKVAFLLDAPTDSPAAGIMGGAG
jgi:MFS family permease